MPEIRVDEDLRSVTEFRANAATVIDRVRSTRRPVVLTQHGRGAVVLVDVRDYQNMIDLVQAPADITASPRQLTRDPVEAYKSGVDRTLLQENLARTPAERIHKLDELARFAAGLHAAPRRRGP